MRIGTLLFAITVLKGALPVSAMNQTQLFQGSQLDMRWQIPANEARSTEMTIISYSKREWNNCFISTHKLLINLLDLIKNKKSGKNTRDKKDLKKQGMLYLFQREETQ